MLRPAELAQKKAVASTEELNRVFRQLVPLANSIRTEQLADAGAEGSFGATLYNDLAKFDVTFSKADLSLAEQAGVELQWAAFSAQDLQAGSPDPLEITVTGVDVFSEGASAWERGWSQWIVAGGYFATLELRVYNSAAPGAPLATINLLSDTRGDRRLSATFTLVLNNTGNYLYMTLKATPAADVNLATTAPIDLHGTLRCKAQSVRRDAAG